MIRNLTPHEVNINGVIFPVSNVIPRLTQTSVGAGSFDGITLIRTGYGSVYDLPNEKDGTLLIVSSMVRTALPNRTDLASPGDLVRDESGNITDGRIKMETYQIDRRNPDGSSIGYSLIGATNAIIALKKYLGTDFEDYQIKKTRAKGYTVWTAICSKETAEYLEVRLLWI